MVGIKSGSRIERNKSEGFQQTQILACVCLFASLKVWKLSNKNQSKSKASTTTPIPAHPSVEKSWM